MTTSHGLDNDYKLALGELIIETSKLESRLTEIIAALANIEIVDALILVHPEQFARKLEKLTALYRLIYQDSKDPNYAPINEMLDHIKDVSEFRNAVVHALWQTNEDGPPKAVRFHARGKLTRSVVPAPYEKIRQCTLEAIELSGELGTLAQGYRELAKSHRTKKE